MTHTHGHHKEPCLHVDELPIGACTLDRDLRYTSVNATLAEINGHPIADHIGRRVYELVPELADTIRPLMHRALSGETFTTGVSGETPKQPGVRRHWNAHYSPLIREGRIVGVAIVATETTAEVRAKAEQRRARARLRRQNDTLRLLTNAMAHDLKSPLATAIMNLDSAARDPACPASSRERIDDAIDALRSGSGMITGLLRIANISQLGAMDIVPFEALCRSIWKRIDALVRTAGPARLEVVGMLPDALGDVDLIGEVLQNLFENAIKHRLANTTCVVSVNASIEGDRVRFAVSDNGPGIDASCKESLFIPFRKSSASCGSGLGLAVAERIVAAHGGEIGVTDSASGGACFAFDLPCYADNFGVIGPEPSEDDASPHAGRPITA
ncbi:MAG: PAS domain-containing sensor histidine kinase [Planctomycetota bacterium]